LKKSLLHRTFSGALQAESFDLTESRDFSIVSPLFHPAEEFSMLTMTANEAKTHFGQLLDKAQRQPVQVTRHDRVVGVMIGADDYEAMRQFYADRLIKSMDEIGARAEANGLTEEKLAELLADES
jgi:prevent-host-death family protein